VTQVEHFSPEDLNEVAALLLAAGSNAHPLIDGTDLVAEVTEGQRMFSMVLDLRRIRELNRVDYDERLGLRIGAAVPFKTILEFPPVRRLYTMLADVLAPVTLGRESEGLTLGARLAAEPPSSAMAVPLICLKASAAIFGPYGWSEAAGEVLFPETGKRVLHPGEFLVDVHFPASPPRSNGAYLRARDPEAPDCGDIGVGAFLVLEQDLLTCCGARIVLSGGAPGPIRVPEAERYLAGQPLDEAVLRQVGDLAAGVAEPHGGLAGGRLDLVKRVTCLAIMLARERIQEGVRSNDLRHPKPDLSGADGSPSCR